MYLMNGDEYECEFCGHREKWDAHDDRRGDMWECENCGRHFCTSCFTEKLGEETWRKMLTEEDLVFCHECYPKRRREFRVNIKETLEMDVFIEAENINAAIAKAEQSWKNGDYILDSEHFKGVEFEGSEV